MILEMAKVLGLITVLALVGLLATLVAASSGSASLDAYRLPDGTLDRMKLGEAVYLEHCVECHTVEGTGKPNVYPPLAGSDWVTGDPETPTRILLGGLTGPVTVEGKTYYGTMPSWQHLDDERLSAVLTYVRSSFGNDAPPVEPGLVKELRPRTPLTSWTATKLERARD